MWYIVTSRRGALYPDFSRLQQLWPGQPPLPGVLMGGLVIANTFLFPFSIYFKDTIGLNVPKNMFTYNYKRFLCIWTINIFGLAHNTRSLCSDMASSSGDRY